MSSNNHYDVIIVGGGLVGASLACALANTPLRTAVIESVPLGDPKQPSYNDRTIALAYSSRRIYETLGIWSAVVDSAVNPIEHIHISDRGHFGLTRLHASDLGIEALGYVIETRALGEALYNDMRSHKYIDLYCPYDVVEMIVEDNVACVTLSRDGNQQSLQGKLVVLADGGRSALRDKMQIQIDSKIYPQVAIVSNVTPGRDHLNTAYERFTADGPLALLPITQDRCAVVWTTPSDKAEEILIWDDEEFIYRLQQRFGNRLGKFDRAGTRQKFPLALTHAIDPVRERLVLVGNAAHTVHPVAGQGFNLGLRDIATLAQLVNDAWQNKKDIGSEKVLNEYIEWRRKDNQRTQMFTDSLINIFSNEFLPLVVGRNLGLAAVDLFPFLKRQFIKRTSGLTGRLPRLARGLPL